MSIVDIDNDQLKKIKNNVSLSKHPIKPSIYSPIQSSMHTHTEGASYCPPNTNTLSQPSTVHNQSNQSNQSNHSNDIHHNRYNTYYNKYYGSIKHKELIYNKNTPEKINNSIKILKIKDMSSIRHILYTHNIISKKDTHMPHAMLLDLYAMLSDTNYTFNIKQC